MSPDAVQLIERDEVDVTILRAMADDFHTIVTAAPDDPEIRYALTTAADQFVEQQLRPERLLFVAGLYGVWNRSTARPITTLGTVRAITPTDFLPRTDESGTRWIPWGLGIVIEPLDDAGTGGHFKSAILHRETGLRTTFVVPLNDNDVRIGRAPFEAPEVTAAM